MGTLDSADCLYRTGYLDSGGKWDTSFSLEFNELKNPLKKRIKVKIACKRSQKMRKNRCKVRESTRGAKK